jgi:hypothetical protein
VWRIGRRGCRLGILALRPQLGKKKGKGEISSLAFNLNQRLSFEYQFIVVKRDRRSGLSDRASFLDEYFNLSQYCWIDAANMRRYGWVRWVSQAQPNLRACQNFS